MSNLTPIAPRVVACDIGGRRVAVIPVVDAARRIGYSRQAVHQILKRNAPLTKLMEVAGEPITMPTACRIRQHWRHTRAALAEQKLFTPLTHNPTPHPAA